MLVDYFSGVVNCWPLTISDYEKLLENIARAKSTLDSITDEMRKSDVEHYSRKFSGVDKCYFFPDISWTAKDILDWFKHIQFTPASPTIDFESQLSAQLILHWNALKLFTKDDWSLLLERYLTYCQKLKTYCPKLTVRSLRTLEELRLFDADAFTVPYIHLPYSERDFTAVVKELHIGIPHMPSGHLQIGNGNIRYLAPYTTMVQSSCMGKTRFLLDSIKEDADSRSFVIYTSMQLNINGVNGTNQFLNKLLYKCHEGFFEFAIFLNYAYYSFIEELVDKEGYLKKEYSGMGGIKADSILAKLDKPLPDIVTEFIGKKRVLKARSENGIEKRLLVVFVIDEAHHLLDYKRSDGSIYNAGGLDDNQFKSSNSNHFSNELEDPILVSGLKDNGRWQMSYFARIRKAYLDCCWGLRAPLIFVSTNPILCKFLPDYQYNPSQFGTVESIIESRFRIMHRTMLLQETMDVWAREIIVSQRYDDYLKSHEYLVNLFLHGRPHWGALQKANFNGFPECQDVILDHAESKLLGQCRLKIPKEVDALALLGQTVGIEPVTTSKFASTLVECRLGILKMVDNFQHSLIAVVHTEPVLALVATKVLFSSVDNNLQSLLEVFSRMTEVGDANIGADGEFVVRLAFYAARMLAAPAVPIEPGVDNTLQAAYPRKLTDVLKFLAPIEAIESSIGDELLDSMVNFTHWIKLESLEKKVGDVKVRLNFENSLQQALVRSSALIIPDNQGVDLAVPMVTKSGKLGAVFINVKNNVESDDVVQTETFLKMSLFAESAQMQGRCLYALAFTSSKKDDQKATISAVRESAVENLRNRHAIEADNAFPAFIIHGVNYDFGDGRENPDDNILPFLSQDRILKIRKHLADLANMYRDSHSRFVPEYAHYYQRDGKIFQGQQESQRSEAIEVEMCQTSEIVGGSCEVHKSKEDVGETLHSESVAKRTRKQ